VDWGEEHSLVSLGKDGNGSIISVNKRPVVEGPSLDQYPLPAPRINPIPCLYANSRDSGQLFGGGVANPKPVLQPKAAVGGVGSTVPEGPDTILQFESELETLDSKVTQRESMHCSLRNYTPMQWLGRLI